MVPFLIVISNLQFSGTSGDGKQNIFVYVPMKSAHEYKVPARDTLTIKILSLPPNIGKSCPWPVLMDNYNSDQLK